MQDVFPLPPCVWHEIALLIYEEDFEPHRVLAKRLALMLISKEIAALTYRVPVQLDLRCASDVSLVKKVLSSTPVSKLWLRYDIRGDEILRDADVRWQSSGSLRELSASISCTDTLQAFFNLQKLHLQASWENLASSKNGCTLQVLHNSWQHSCAGVGFLRQ